MNKQNKSNSWAQRNDTLQQVFSMLLGIPLRLPQQGGGLPESIPQNYAPQNENTDARPHLEYPVYRIPKDYYAPQNENTDAHPHLEYLVDRIPNDYNFYQQPDNLRVSPVIPANYIIPVRNEVPPQKNIDDTFAGGFKQSLQRTHNKVKYANQDLQQIINQEKTIQKGLRALDEAGVDYSSRLGVKSSLAKLRREIINEQQLINEGKGTPEIKASVAHKRRLMSGLLPIQKLYESDGATPEEVMSWAEIYRTEGGPGMRSQAKLLQEEDAYPELRGWGKIGAFVGDAAVAAPVVVTSMMAPPVGLAAGVGSAALDSYATTNMEADRIERETGRKISPFRRTAQTVINTLPSLITKKIPVDKIRGINKLPKWGQNIVQESLTQGRLGGLYSLTHDISSNLALGNDISGGEIFRNLGRGMGVGVVAGAAAGSGSEALSRLRNPFRRIPPEPYQSVPHGTYESGIMNTPTNIPFKDYGLEFLQKTTTVPQGTYESGAMNTPTNIPFKDYGSEFLQKTATVPQGTYESGAMNTPTNIPFGSYRSEIPPQTTQIPYGTYQSEVGGRQVEIPYGEHQSKTTGITPPKGAQENTNIPHGTYESEAFGQPTRIPYGTYRSEIPTQPIEIPHGTYESEAFGQPTRIPYDTYRSEIPMQPIELPHGTYQLEIQQQPTEIPHGTYRSDILGEPVRIPYDIHESGVLNEPQVVPHNTYPAKPTVPYDTYSGHSGLVPPEGGNASIRIQPDTYTSDLDKYINLPEIKSPFYPYAKAFGIEDLQKGLKSLKINRSGSKSSKSGKSGKKKKKR